MQARSPLLVGAPLLCDGRRRLPACLLLLYAPSMQAAVLRACRPTDTPLVCRLQAVLNVLYAAAIILAALLIVAVLAAVRAYNRKPKKLTPPRNRA